MIKIENNATTGEILETALTAKEIKDQEATDAAWQAVKVQSLEEAAAKATEKAALLNKLGITADEATLLLS